MKLKKTSSFVAIYNKELDNFVLRNNQLDFPLSSLEKSVLDLIDGNRSVTEIYKEIRLSHPISLEDLYKVVDYFADIGVLQDRVVPPVSTIQFAVREPKVDFSKKLAAGLIGAVVGVGMPLIVHSRADAQSEQDAKIQAEQNSKQTPEEQGSTGSTATDTQAEQASKIQAEQDTKIQAEQDSKQTPEEQGSTGTGTTGPQAEQASKIQAEQDSKQSSNNAVPSVPTPSALTALIGMGIAAVRRKKEKDN